MVTGVELPTGVVTFVFTDIEGSTRLLRELGEGYDAVLDLHNETLRRVWQDGGGHELGTEGDSFFVAFADADAAIASVVEVQRAIGAAPWPHGGSVRVRIGVHTGYARPTGGNYRALAVHQAARVIAAAHGGQILTTRETVSRLTHLAADVRVTPLGRYRIRDFDDPTELYSITAGGMPVVDGKPLARPADGHNLVRPTTPLIGRAGDLATLTGMVRAGHFVTVIGPGGVGKTRLVTELAIDSAPEWADGVWFVDLAAVSSPEVIAMAVADAVGAPIAPGVDAWESVLAHLVGRRALVVLDNCEHLLAGVARYVVQLLEHCPDVALLATSRAPLGLRAESVYRLGPLPSADQNDAGILLFLERSAIDPSSFDLGSVTALCAELDGLPLAIELAAARTTALSPASILDRLRHSRSVLAGHDPSLPQRQRSLELTLDWSYQLLAPAAQAVLRRLAVFAGSFDLPAAEAACAAGDLGVDDVAELVWSLVDSSLLQVDGAGASRYRVLRTVRAYASARCDRDEAAAAVRRLAQFYLGRVGPAQVIGREWLGLMASELDNIRQVVVVLSREGGHDGVEAAQELAWSIGCFHDGSDSFRIGIQELDLFVENLAEASPSRVGLLALLADLHLRLGELDEAAPLLAAAQLLASEVGNPPWDDAAVARGLGELATRRNEIELATSIAREGLRSSCSPRSRTRLLNLLGIALAAAGEIQAAADVFGDEIEAAHEAGMETFLVNSHGNRAEMLLRLGDQRGAAAHQLECLELARSMRQPVQVAYSMIVAAHLVGERGDPAAAVRLQAAADVVLERAEIAMYEQDLQRRRLLLDEARDALGGPAFDEALAGGRSVSMETSADAAGDELRQVAAGQNLKETP